MKKEKIKTTASKEAMRWADSDEAPVARGPGKNGNDFDVSMRMEPDGAKAANKIAGIVKQRGVCLLEANAPVELLQAAWEEAEELWEDGKFGPPLRVSDDRALVEAQLWNHTLVEEEKVCWLKDSVRSCAALKVLAGNISDFSGGLAEPLRSATGVGFNKHGHVMLSCYTGDRHFSLHLDNPHGGDDDDRGMPDNGMRLTLTYFINVHWDHADNSSAGGLDIHLTDPSGRPESMAAARKAPKLRIAPHADTLVVFLSERMAHQVIRTEGSQRWYAMTLWGLDGQAMQQMMRKMLERQRPPKQEDSDDDGD